MLKLFVFAECWIGIKLSSAHLAFLEALNLALKSPNPPASLEADVITAEHDDDRPLIFEDGAAAASAAAVSGLVIAAFTAAPALPSERARFRRELRLARNPNMAASARPVVARPRPPARREGTSYYPLFLWQRLRRRRQ